MNSFYLFILFLCTLPQTLSKVSAKLSIKSYDPLEFNLTFSQAIPLPRFQLLFNEYPIKYTTTILGSNPNMSTSFLIQGSTQNMVRPEDFITQKYVLMFTEPLQIAKGSLNLDSFLLRAQKTFHKNYFELHQCSFGQSYYKYQNTTKAFNQIAIIIVCFVYFLVYTTLIGHNAYAFLSIFVYISLNSQLYTSLDYRVAFYLFFEPHQIQSGQINKFIYICIPFILILGTFIIGIVSFLTLRKFASRSVLWNYLFDFLSFKLFITTWNIMCIPIFANMSFILQKRLVFETISATVVSFYVYFSVATIAFFSYFSYFIMNPHISQKWQNWVKYTQSAEYELFEGVHFGMIEKIWMKRNLPVFISLVRISIMVCVNLDIIEIPNLLFQIGYLIYLFAYMPFKHNYFNYMNISSQFFVVIFYLYRYVVHLYMGISDEITTSTDISRILMTNVVFVLLIQGIYLVLGIAQYYSRIRVFLRNLNKCNRDILEAKNIAQIPKIKYQTFRKELKRDSYNLPVEKQKRQNKKQPKVTKISSNQSPSKQTKQKATKQLDPQKSIKNLSPNNKKTNIEIYESRSLKNSRTVSKLNSSQIQRPDRKLKKDKSSLLQSICLSQEGQIF